MSYLDGLLGRVIQWAGTVMPKRGALNFKTGFTLTDNPTTGATDVVVGNSADTPQFASVKLGSGTFPADSDALIQLPAGVSNMLAATGTNKIVPIMTIDSAGPDLLIGLETDADFDSFRYLKLVSNNEISIRIEDGSGGDVTHLVVNTDGLQLTRGTQRLKIDATGIVFGTGSTVATPDITGSRANPEQALANLLTALASLKLITNNTTA